MSHSPETVTSQTSKVRFFARFAVSAVALIVLITMVDPAAVMKTLRSFDLRYLPLFFLFWLASKWLGAYRWALLLRPLKIRFRFREMFYASLVGSFLNFIVPGDYGADVIRFWNMYSLDRRAAEPALSLLMDKIMGLYGCAVLGLFTLLLAGSTLSLDALFILWAVYASLVGLALLYITGWWRAPARWLAQKIKADSIRSALSRGNQIAHLYRTHWRYVCGALAVAVLIRALMVVSIHYYAESLGVQIDWFYLFLFIPAIMIFASIPMTIHSLGVREGLFVYFFSQVGVAAADALAVSLLVFAWQALASLLCGPLYLFSDTRFEKIDDES